MALAIPPLSGGPILVRANKGRIRMRVKIRIRIRIGIRISGGEGETSAWLHIISLRGRGS